MIDSTQMRILNSKDTAPRSFSKYSNVHTNTIGSTNYPLQMKKKQPLTTTPCPPSIS